MIGGTGIMNRSVAAPPPPTPALPPPPPTNPLRAIQEFEKNKSFKPISGQSG